MNSIKAWFHKHRKAVIVTGTILAIVGVVAIIVINGKKVKVPVKELAKAIVPEVPTAAEAAAETVTVNVDGVVKTFCRRNKLTGVRAAVSVPEDLSAMPATQSLILEPDGGNNTDTEKPESVEKPGDSRKRKTFTVKLEFAEHDDETAVSDIIQMLMRG